MRIKVERRFARGSYQEGTEPVYDIYISPLISEWKIDKSALTREEALAYIGKFALDRTRIAIIDC